MMKKKMVIKVKKGALHKDLGVPAGQPIPAAKLAAAKNSDDPLERKRATFAENAKKWNQAGGKTVRTVKVKRGGSGS